MDKNNDLIELKNYIENKYNIGVTINIPKKFTNVRTIKHVYINLFIIFILTLLFIFCIYFLLSNKKFTNIKKKYFIFNSIFYILITFIILLIIYYLQKNLFMAYYYHKNNNKYENNSINVNNIDFNTGDILQESSNWNYNYGFLLYLSKLDFIHNLFIFKFNNKNYILHFYLGSPGYPENYLTFNGTKYLEICRLEDYLKDNYFCTKYYRLFKYNKKLDTDKIFDCLKNLDIENLKFTFSPCTKDCENNKYNCMSFILKLLIDLNIIPKFNISNFTSNDLIYLENISNNSYDKPSIIRI